MDLDQYVKDAVRTESRIDEVSVNGRLLINTLALFISAGQMLDQIKKRTFYRKEFDGDTINSAYLTAANAMDDIAGTALNAEEDVYDVDPRVFHAIIGIATESTELCEALYDTLLSDRDFDIVNLLEENGDINWYQAIMMDTLGGDWAKILDTNIAKLKERYPDKFTNEDAINRDLVTEREILDTLK